MSSPRAVGGLAPALAEVAGPEEEEEEEEDEEEESVTSRTLLVWSILRVVKWCGTPLRHGS
jgi:hypothetical protein